MTSKDTRYEKLPLDEATAGFVSRPPTQEIPPPNYYSATAASPPPPPPPPPGTCTIPKHELFLYNLPAATATPSEVRAWLISWYPGREIEDRHVTQRAVQVALCGADVRGMDEANLRVALSRFAPLGNGHNGLIVGDIVKARKIEKTEQTKKGVAKEDVDVGAVIIMVIFLLLLGCYFAQSIYLSHTSNVEWIRIVSGILGLPVGLCMVIAAFGCISTLRDLSMCS